MGSRGWSQAGLGAFHIATHIGHWRISSAAMFALILLVIAGCASQSQSDEKTIEPGLSLYAENCQACHGDAESGLGGIPNAPVHGPDGHTWHHADGQLTSIILGQLDYPGRTMPSFADTLEKEDVIVILDYFKSNWEAEQLDFQAEASRNWESLQKK